MKTILISADHIKGSALMLLCLAVVVGITTMPLWGQSELHSKDGWHPRPGWNNAKFICGPYDACAWDTIGPVDECFRAADYYIARVDTVVESVPCPCDTCMMACYCTTLDTIWQRYVTPKLTQAQWKRLLELLEPPKESGLKIIFTQDHVDSALAARRLHKK